MCDLEKMIIDRVLAHGGSSEHAEKLIALYSPADRGRTVNNGKSNYRVVGNKKGSLRYTWASLSLSING
jgi:hypothetical protein